MTYTNDQLNKMGYIMICAVMFEIIVAGKRMAYANELKSIKMLVNLNNVDLDEDSDLLRILDEPQVKFASELADFTRLEILQPYSKICYLDDEAVLSDEWSVDTAWKFFWRYTFFRVHPRVRDRYINFNRLLLSLQRAVFEFMKLLLSGQTRAFTKKYRTNYSPGRLKVLMAVGDDDDRLVLFHRLIGNLKDYEARSRAMTVVLNKKQ